MRLIDADKLKLQLSEAGTVHGPVLQTVNEISEIIDAQPVVENESEKLKEILNRINQVSEIFRYIQKKMIITTLFMT